VGVNTIHDGDFLTRNGAWAPFSGVKKQKMRREAAFSRAF
jgi:hypothetical protein